MFFLGGGNSAVFQSFMIDTEAVSDRANVIVNIANHEDYDQYFASLSKNARQNLRTAYNRLNRDAKDVDFKFVENISDKQFSEEMQLYFKRHEQRYGLHTSFLKRWYLKHLNYSSRSLRNHKDAVHAMIYIDGTLVGFMAGYLKDNRWIIPRLSINADYRFYSPGIILIDKAIKHMFDQGIKLLDLAQGNEPYKYQMGGTCVKSYSFKVKGESIQE
jgi:CelD/BcsL family acetyltransferase involved in cellulose biosynthesis